MTPQTPCSDYVETNGVMFFARMLDKIRLQARGELPEGYNVGFADPTSFDTRFCRFWDIDFEEARAKTLGGASDTEVFDFCFRNRPRPNAEQVLVWNSFLLKRGWRDEGAASLAIEKERSGFADRTDIYTWVDLHDAVVPTHDALRKGACRASFVHGDKDNHS
jgi:gluconokinase